MKEKLEKIEECIKDILKLIDENKCLKIDKKSMADKLYEYEMKEYNSKSKEQKLKEYEKENCKDCRYYNGFSRCKYIYENEEIMKPIRTKDDFFPGHQNCGHFKWD